MQQLIGGLGRRSATYSGNYWTEEAERRDRERKALRSGSIPVPAAVLAANKEVDAQTRAELLVDWLADKDNFHHMTLNTPGFARMPIDQQLREIEALMEDVKAAPLNQQESARQGLVDELKGVGGLIGRGLKTAWDAVDVEIPYVDPAMDWAKSKGWEVAERGAQEIGGSVLRAAQQFIPGEQAFEASIRAERGLEKLPWWKQYTGMALFDKEGWVESFTDPLATSRVVREEGWQVPWYVHLPLEVVFDPWNLALGAGFIPDIARGLKGLKGVGILGTMAEQKTMGGKWVRKGTDLFGPTYTWVDTDIGLGRKGRGKILTPTEVAAREAARRSAQIAKDVAKLYDGRQQQVWDLQFDDMMEHELGEASEVVDPKTGKKVTGWVLEDGRVVPAIGGGQKSWHEADTVSKSWSDKVANANTMTGDEFILQDEASDAHYLSHIRDAPWRESLWDTIEQSTIPEPAKWALKMLYHTGLRPNELQYITNEALDNALKPSEVPSIVISVGEGSSRKQSSRRLTDEAVDFIKEFRAQQQQLPLDVPQPSTLEAAFSMPVGETLNATSINKYFKQAAEEFGDPGAALLKFYEPNGNYSYVFRLSFANHMYMTTPGIRQTMLALGHRSHFHTARYVSSTFYNMQTIEELFKGTSSINRNQSKIPAQSFFPEGIIDEVEDELKKLAEEKGWEPLSIFGVHNRPPATQKGFTQFEEQRQAVLDARLRLMRTIGARPDLQRNGEHMLFGLPATGIEPETAELAQKMQELGVFATFVSDMIIEKGLLKTSKELVDTGVGINKVTIKEKKDAAKLAFSALEEWISPILDQSTIWARAIDSDPGTGEGLANMLLLPFQQLGFSELNKLGIEKKGGAYGGRGGQPLIPLADIFNPFYVSHNVDVEALRKKKKPTKKDKILIAADDKWKAMTDSQRERMQKNDYPINYIIKQSGRKGLKVVEGVKEKASENLWVVTEWEHAPVEGQSERLATIINFMSTPSLKPTAEDMIIHGTGAKRKAMLVVHVDGQGPQAFYRAVGEEGVEDGTWLPFDGVHTTNEFVSKSKTGGAGTIDTTAFNLPEHAEFAHYRDDPIKKMSEKLTAMDVAGDLPWKKAKRVANLEEINSWINTTESLKRNLKRSQWRFNPQGDVVPKAGLSQSMIVKERQLGEVIGAKITKLASEAIKDGFLVRARQTGEDLERNLTRDEMQNWNQWFNGPVPESIMRNAFPGGPGKLSSIKLAAMVRQVGLHLSEIQVSGITMRQLRARLKSPGHKAPSKERLFGRPGKPTGLLEELPQEGYGEPRYKFTEDVMEEIRKVSDTDNPEQSEGWNWGQRLEDPLQVAGAGEGSPPRGAKPPGTVDDFSDPWGVGKERPADWHPLQIKDQKGIIRTLGEILVNPRGMWQPGMQFAGGKAAKAFFEGLQTAKIPFTDVGLGGVNKVLRMGVPGTFGASEAAKIRWQYMFAKKQGQLISSDIGHILGEFKTVTGMGNDGVCSNLIPLGKVDNFGRAVDDAGTLLTKDQGIRSHPANRVMESEFDNLLVGDDEGYKWTESRINSIRKGWDHRKNLQDASTFLQTPREDLAKYYDVTHTWKVRGAGPTHIHGQTMGWDDMLKMHDYYHQIDPQLWNMMEDAGMDMAELLPSKVKTIDPHFVPALLTSKASGSDVGIKVGTEIGTKPAQFMERQYTWQIQGKIRAGASSYRIKHDIYNADPVLAMQRQVEAYYNFVADERFIDEYTKLGIPQSQRETAIGAGMAIRKHRFPTLGDEPAELTEATKAAAIQFYGPDWQNLSKIDITNRINQLREIDAAYSDMTLRKATDFIVESKPLGAKGEGAGIALPPDASRELLALGADEVNALNPVVNFASAMANMMRLMATGADLGVMLLHGFGGMGMMLSPTGYLPATIKGKRTPWAGLNIPWKQRKAWASGAGHMMQGMLSREVRRQWYQSTAMTRAEMQQYGVAFFRSTFVEDLPLPGIFSPAGRRGKITKPGEIIVELGMKPIEGFGYFLDVSKTEMWKANQLGIEMSAGIKRGPTKFRLDENGTRIEVQGDIIEGDIKLYQEQMADFAASLNAVHGTLEPAVAGIQSKQRVFESAFLMYAALYRRSALALVKNMFSGVPAAAGKLVARHGDPELGRLGAAAHELQRRKWRRGPALQALSGMAMAAGVLGGVVKMTGNNEDVFDPGSADFMSIHAGGIRIGLGTAYYSLVRASHDLVAQMADDPSGIYEVSWSENAIMRWSRSQSSPVTSLGIDVITGETFTGSPLRDTNGGWEVNEIGSRTGRTFIPFWLESSLHAENKTDSAFGSLSEFFGLRVSPMSPWSILQAARESAILLDNDPDLAHWRREQERLGLPVNGNTVPSLYLRRLIERTPYLQDLEDKVSEDTQKRGSTARKDQDDFIRQINDNKTAADEKIKGLAEQFERQELSGTDFRKALETIETELRGQNMQLGETYADVIRKFDERRTGRLDNPADIFVMDYAYDLYRLEVTNNPDLHDAFGNFDVKKFMVLENEFRVNRKINTQTWDYIKAKRKEGRNLPQAVIDLNIARDPDTGLHDYWNIHETVFGSTSYPARLIDTHRQLPTQQAKDMFEMQNPMVTRLLKVLDKAKTIYRLKNPSKDRMLVRFYDYNPIHPGSARDLISARRNVPIPTVAA